MHCGPRAGTAGPHFPFCDFFQKTYCIILMLRYNKQANSK